MGVCLLMPVLGFSAEDRYFPIEAVKPGMTGYGKTVFQGTQIEKFQVEILGVMKNIYPGQDLILARCSGGPLAQTGVIQGMSGSPVYLEDKLIGALAYAWPFAKEPLAGITPISNMLEIPEMKDRHRASITAKDKLGRDMAQRVASGGLSLEDGRLRLPLAVANLSPEVFAILSDEMKPFGMVPVQGGGTTMAGQDVPLEPGGVMGLALITGDMDISAVGTVTERIGDRVYGFGHPMMAEGRVDFPLTSGMVHAVVSSMEISFKLASPIKVVGRISDDRTPGVYGKIGELPKMIAVELDIQREGIHREHQFQVASHPRLSPVLVGVACLESILFRGELPPDNTIYYQMTFHAKGIEPLEIKNIETGAYSLSSFYRELSEPVANLLDNRFKKVPVSRITVKAEITEGDISTRIDSVVPLTNEASPGDEVTFKVRMTPFRGDAQWRRVKVTIPANAPEGPMLVLCCGADESQMLDDMENPYARQPRDFDALLEDFHDRTGRDHIMIRLRTQDQSVAVDGIEMHGLPPSVMGVFRTSQGSMSFPIPRTRVTKHKTERMIYGFAATVMNIKRKDRP